MAKTNIKFNVIDRKQNQTSLEVEEGTTIKDAISNNLTPNNYGNCGGDCICGSCQIHLEPGDLGKLIPPNEEEQGTLESMAINPTKNSRLACQIKINKELEGITVTIAPE